MASKAFFLCVTFWLFLFLIISFFLQYRLKLLIAIYAQGVGSLAAGRTGLRGTKYNGSKRFLNYFLVSFTIKDDEDADECPRPFRVQTEVLILLETFLN